MQITHRELLLGIITISLLASAIGTGTLAYFTDTEKSGLNTMTAGILDLYVNGQNSGTWNLVIGDMKPGYVNLTAPITLRIVDNPGKLYVKITNIVCGQGVQTPFEMAEENGVPQFNLDNYTWFDMGINTVPVIVDGQYTVGTLQGIWKYLGNFQPQTDLSVVQSFHLQPTVTNWAQGDTCTFTEEFMVRQINDPTVP
jgi:predicted ribosomally synthesized peptide with SipW-like signal peptide